MGGGYTHMEYNQDMEDINKTSVVFNFIQIIKYMNNPTYPRKSKMYTSKSNNYTMQIV